MTLNNFKAIDLMYRRKKSRSIRPKVMKKTLQTWHVKYFNLDMTLHSIKEIEAYTYNEFTDKVVTSKPFDNCNYWWKQATRKEYLDYISSKL